MELIDCRWTLSYYAFCTQTHATITIMICTCRLDNYPPASARTASCGTKTKPVLSVMVMAVLSALSIIHTIQQQRSVCVSVYRVWAGHCEQLCQYQVATNFPRF